MSKKVAVVILNWNGVDFLRKFIPILVQNTPSHVADIVVADNGSSDNSLSYLSEEHPTVRTICFDRNYGFTGGYNRAISQIDNQYSILLNSDIEVGAGWLEPLVNAMDASPKVGACMPKLRSYSNRETFEYAGAAGGYLDRYGYPFCRGRILSTIENDLGQYDSPTSVFWATGACLMVRTNLYNSLGGLDSDFFAHMEEIDFCWRLQHAGYRVVVEPSSIVYHVGGGTLPNDNPRKMYLNFRNSLLMLTKNLPSSMLFTTIFTRMVLDGVAGAAFLAKGKWGFFVAVLKAHRDFYRMLPTFLKKRKEIGLHQPEGFYRKSIIISYFVKGKKRFSDLNPSYFSK
jgi:GT2 family glycosyltransferase